MNHVKSILQSVDHVESILQSVDHVESTLQSVDHVQFLDRVHFLVFPGLSTFPVFPSSTLLGFPWSTFLPKLGYILDKG